VAASETAVAADAEKEVVLADLAAQAALDFLPWVEESFAQEPSVEEAHLLVVAAAAAAAVVAFPMAVVAAETEALPIAAADVIAAQETAAGVVDLAAVAVVAAAAAAAVVEVAAVDFDLAFRKEYVHQIQAVAVHAAYSAN